MKNLTDSTPSLNTAVLFIVFNRPSNTTRVFEAIRNARPLHLYITSDGPRVGNKDDIEKVAKVRQIVSNVDWPCEVKFMFHNENLGCQFGPKSGIDWLFQNEEQGIILEDDCLPNLSFFLFCEEMLTRYKTNNSIMSITGTNITSGIEFEHDYFISHYALMWGWATWRRAWSRYDSSLSEWENLKKTGWLRNMPIGSIPFQKSWTNTFDLTKKLGNKATWWDYQWIYSCWLNNGMTIAPASNLIRNIGHSIDATHTLEYHPILSNLTLNEIQWPLNHPENLRPNIDADLFIGKHWFSVSWSEFLKTFIRNIPGFKSINKIRKKIRKI